VGVDAAPVTVDSIVGQADITITAASARLMSFFIFFKMNPSLKNFS
jgi:hypothetical protein